MEGGGPREAYGQPAGLAQRHAAHAVHGLIHQRDDVAGVFEQRAAAFRQFHAARQAVKQRDAQLMLKHADLLTERGLTDAEPGRGLGQVRFFGHRTEVAQKPQVYGCHTQPI
ncbi:hypothetical protein D3C72_2039560 [compost metagenome]